MEPQAVEYLKNHGYWLTDDGRWFSPDAKYEIAVGLKNRYTVIPRHLNEFPRTVQGYRSAIRWVREHRKIQRVKNSP